ncbi:MAG: cytochrome P450 [Chitinophagales bacterium]
METAAAKKSVPPFPKEKHWLFGSGYLLRNKTIDQIKFFIKKYGEIFSLSLPLNRVVVAAKPEFARHVLLDNSKNYTKSLAYDILKLLLGNGLLTSEGDLWKQQRRLIAPAFHRKKLEQLTAEMIELTEHAVERLKTKTGQQLDMALDLTDLTLQIISKAMFSSAVDEKSALVGKQITLLNEYSIEKLNQPFRLPASFPTPFNIKERKAIKILNDVIYDIINARRKGEAKDDLLSMLIDARDEDTGEAMDDVQLRDEVMTIFIAGNETTANALAWTLYLLSQNPEAEAKMVQEIDEKLNAGLKLDFNTVQSFQYVRMVIDESMRIYPPAWSVGRRNIEDDELGGYRIIKGTNVLIPIIYFHHNEKYWDEPMKFKPERFSPENKHNIDRFVYFPFGGGPRTCIGNNFALLEMQIILILFYRNFRFKLKEGFTVEVDPLITLRPKNGMVMQLQSR